MFQKYMQNCRNQRCPDIRYLISKLRDTLKTSEPEYQIMALNSDVHSVFAKMNPHCRLLLS